MADHPEASPGINSWLEEELYQNWRHNRKYVDESWKTVFEGNGQVQPAKPEPASPAAADDAPPAVAAAPGEQVVPLRGIAGKIAENMTASLSVPTATSQRLIAVSPLEQARRRINDQRTRAGESKVSFTHLISYAIVRALEQYPGLNGAFTEKEGQPHRIVRGQINLGIAVDVPAKDGGSSLLVPNIKNATALGFAAYLAAFDDIVSRARSGQLQLSDFQDTTISLTNPGTVGTFGSVPRLMPGQGAILATGVMRYPAEYSNTPPERIAELGLSKVMMVTCTYDHRVIQGAESGRFLARIEALLNGEDGFYETIYQELAIGIRGAAAAPPRPEVAPVRISAAPTAPGKQLDPAKEAAVILLLDTMRERGHLAAQLDPLGSHRPAYRPLDPSYYGLADADLDGCLQTYGGRTARAVVEWLREIYCRHTGYEYGHLPLDEREWLRTRIERPGEPLPPETRSHLLDLLLEAEQFEQFLHARFIGKKRFSIEGGETAIVTLDEILDRAAAGGAGDVVMGMAHRGRLTILANIVGKSLQEVFAEFEEVPDPSNPSGSGDVKYHLGASGVRKTASGREIRVSVAFNPSHLEAVDPVVEGMVRPRQDRLGDTRRERVIPILIHGDAAFTGQGVVFETLNLTALEGYRTGGTIHLVINNQLGFTTTPAEGRSSTYATDIAHAAQAPIFHVNADDPEAVLRVAQLAYDYRQQYKRDVVIDLVCYRRHGHNEGDDPGYTQPLMYKQIRKHPTVFAQYAERLIREGAASQENIDGRKKAFAARLADGFEHVKRNAEAYEIHEFHPGPPELSPEHTRTGRSTLERVLNGLTSMPGEFRLHPKLKGALEKRREVLNHGPMDWATGEALAFGSLLLEGTPVRLTGQDSARGTFSQRHLELFDYETGRGYVPLQHLAPGQARFEAIDSPLSEYAAMGFEFGYTLGDPEALVLWEAQFGDFVNGGQIIVDQFLASAETKWGAHSGLVLLLPHGYEGMGPEHSSARIERFLQLCAEYNMIVANCTTPAQYFHILRRHMRGTPGGRPVQKPLVIFTPKSMLRHPKAVSFLPELTEGQFHEVLPDTGGGPPDSMQRVLFCSGKIFYDLLAGREQRKAAHVAIVRVEQMYPFPQPQVEAVLDQYPPAADVFWVQEEARNMGPWQFMQDHIQPVLDTTRRVLNYAGRPEAASPAAGYLKRHEQEQADIVTDAFAPKPVARRPKRVKVVRRSRQ
ncbi:MAG: multifunctional oxoglutarate decarboxylase/oxoglutarate dehydrogenase thiamine pyrophosphate-binding subunit/dihydrolipoyllysine-residue succinyltransferase subunit [Acidobacteria bacterium]|nr:multifunctional oxoglutarate decarboxylase/oxoglutarate dehydrogenase thiamine pyrophosphate-binding subunit/dihydrolipoyllysine-residue succinyltransferase subunit [Acidobacteriota bacterium]